MARRPFRIVADIDLSGNRLLDAREISRSDYENLTRDLTIKAGSGVAVAGGSLNLFSGAGTAPGAINLFLGKDTVNKYGIELLGSSAATIKTNNQHVTIATGTASVKITSVAEASSNVTGALQVAGGIYVGKNVFLSGAIVTDKASIAIVNETATTVNLAGAATTLNLAAAATAAQVINVGTGVVGSIVQSITLGGATSAGTVTIASTKDASASDAALKISGGLLSTKAIVGLTGLSLPNSSITNAITLGADVVLYRSAADVLTIGDSLTLLGAELVGPATFDVAKNSTVLSIGAATGSTTVRNSLVVNGNGEIKGTIPYIYFAPRPAAPGSTEGLLYYNSVDKALNYLTDIADVTISLGQESVIRVYNGTGAPIPNGSVIYLTGTVTDGVPNCAMAQANNNVTARVVGVATNTLAPGTVGYATSAGVVHDVNTSAFTAGALLYLSGDTPGGFAPTPPNSTNYAIRIARVLTVGTTGSVLVNLGIAWSDTSTFNIVRINELTLLNKLILPLQAAPDQVANGAAVWDSDNFLLTIGTGASRKVVVDTDSSQALSNKTINGLTITSSTGTLTIGNSIAVNLAAALSVQTGAVALTGNVAGSSGLVLPNASITLSTLTSGHVLYASAANTIAGEAQLAVSRGGTGLASYTAGDLLYASGTATLSKLAKGTAHQILGMNAAGTAPEYKTVTGGGDVIVSNEAGVLTIATTQSVAPTANVSFASLTLSGDLAVNGGDITSTATTFNLLNGNVTTLNMLGAASSTLKIGADDASTRLVNFFAGIQIGTVDNARTVNHYGQFNFGGPTGFTIQWNAADNSLDFIKL